MPLMPSNASVRPNGRKRPVLLACVPLLLALSTVFIFSNDQRSYLYRDAKHMTLTHHKMSISANLSLDHNFLMFYRQTRNADGTLSYEAYNRFPIGGYVLIALVIMPFGDDLAAQLYAARTLMLVCFVATALLAYLSLCRLTLQPWIAASATLMAFSSYYCLFHSDAVINEGGLDLLGVMLTFHGMVIFVQTGRFRQLIVKTCLALLLGWHVYALLLCFIALGLAREGLRARSAPFKRQCAVLLCSRYVLLGIVALLVGLSLLTFNFANEYIALRGEKSLTELPSFQSMIFRTGMDTGVRPRYSHLDWGVFLLGQFSRIGGLSTPYFILPSLGAIRPPPSYVPLSAGVGVGVFVACLFGVCVFLTRPRILWATLVLFGFCWALPMRHNVKLVVHAFESVFYIGLPLVFFSLILLCLSRRFKAPPLMVGFSCAALIVFVLSNFQMSHLGYDADETRRQKVALSDATAIRRLTADDDLIVVPRYTSKYEIASIRYYLNRRIIHAHSLIADGFTLLYDRLDTDALLTPQNERIFLYDSKKLLQGYRQAYQQVVVGEPLARSTFDVYRDGTALYYVKTPCSDADMTTRFSVHLFPADAADLPIHRRLFGHDLNIFNFSDRGLRFDEKCLARNALPQYDIARIETRSLSRDSSNGSAYGAVLEGYRQAYQRVVAGEPVARSTFDVYRDERVLYYVKTPCSDEDVKDTFFLHIFPADASELPIQRRPYRYDNDDFEFSSQGQKFDSKCLASIALPQYDIVRIKTGQYKFPLVLGRVWEAEIFLEDPSK